MSHTSTVTITTIATSPTVAPIPDERGLDDAGHGEPALLMLPGWCGDRSVFSPLAGPLSQHRRTLTADLRGQGGRAFETADFDSTQQVRDLVDLIEARGVSRVIPVALAHAGWFAIELRRRLGADRVPGIVLLDWMVLGTPPGFDDALAGLQAPASWEQVRGALFGMWTTGVESDDVHRYVAAMGEYRFEHWSRAGREISASFASEGSPLAALSALSPACPVLHIYSQPTDESYLAAQQQIARDQAWFQVARVDARSHFPMLEVPGTISALIEEFASSTTAS